MGIGIDEVGSQHLDGDTGGDAQRAGEAFESLGVTGHQNEVCAARALHDARGVARAFDLAGIAPATGGNNADIGAVEVAPQVVINTDDAGTGSLRQAILVFANIPLALVGGLVFTCSS